MNIVFEGINGAGKTTIIKRLVEIMKDAGLNVYQIDEINEMSPLSSVLSEMYKTDTFLRMKKSFNTVITESLILAADYHFLQEATKNLQGYKIFDRDIITQVVYQKYFLASLYGDNNSFFENWEKCLKFNMKKIDLIVYIDVPDKVGLERTIQRDGVPFYESDIKIMRDLYKLQKQYAIKFCEENFIPLILIDGTKGIDENADFLYSKIKGIDC